MNFMGMGLMELAVILLVAFLVLGPSKSIDLARTAGKVIRDVRSSFADLAAAVDLEQQDQSGTRQAASAADPEEEKVPEPRNE
ncbi:MAG: twin-arginine translocase TatA/TatE family subunit [Chloroflexi bacterium]|nr:twin-arginine translocase TatA/TatE family subunit [Chloroflexota bacterium]